MEHEKNLIGPLEIDQATRLIKFEQFKQLYVLQFQYTFEGQYMQEFNIHRVNREFNQDKYNVLPTILDLFNLSEELYKSSHKVYFAN